MSDERASNEESDDFRKMVEEAFPLAAETAGKLNTALIALCPTPMHAVLATTIVLKALCAIRGWDAEAFLSIVHVASGSPEFCSLSDSSERPS